MGDISTEQKLQLVQMIRAESRDNRMKMRSRERMLYGIDNNRKDEELPLYAKGYYDIESGREKEMHALEESGVKTEAVRTGSTLAAANGAGGSVVYCFFSCRCGWG